MMSQAMQPVRVPTRWTLPLQRAAAALMAAEIFYGCVLTPLALLSIDVNAVVFPTGSGMLSTDETFRTQLMHLMVLFLAAASFVISLGWGLVLLMGCLKRWRWVFWWLMITGVLVALNLPSDVTGLVQNGGANTFQMAAWWFAVTSVLGAADLALSIWMLVALKRFGTWACVQVPPPP